MSAGSPIAGPASSTASAAAETAECNVHVRSFLLSSSFDLKKLRPKFRDVLLAHGTDYLVLGFRPTHGAGSGVLNGTSTGALNGTGFPNAVVPPALRALEAKDTYFVVFRYGAVVLFQGVPSPPAAATNAPAGLRTRAHTVRLPNGKPHHKGPWDSSEQEWRRATEAKHDSQLISLLLRPFMQAVSASQDVQDNILAMKAPPPLQGLDLSGTHTILAESLSPHGRTEFGGPQPLMYNESVRLVVQPSQEKFIEQGQDVFAIKQLDVGVLRCVASALGQSCSLDFYSSRVDAAIQLARRANLSMMQTGVFRTQVNFKQVIGYCALMHSAIISQLGLMDKNELAWQYEKYDKMVEMLRNEFELDKRIKHLQEKIELVARDAATFVAFQQNDKSHLLESVIVVLIFFEIMVGMLDISLHASSLDWKSIWWL